MSRGLFFLESKMQLPALVACVVLLAGFSKANEVDTERLKCLVCRSVMEEIGGELSKIDPKKQIEIGNYRLDNQGNIIRKKVPLAQSEVHISDILDNVCERFSDYVRATDKVTGELKIFNLVLPGGAMNPMISEVNIVQDEDLNKSLNYLCTDIVEEHEEPIIKHLGKGSPNAINEICTRETSMCDDTVPSEEDEDVVDMDKDEL